MVSGTYFHGTYFHYGGAPRSPLLPLNDAQKDTLRSVLVGAGILGTGIGG